MMSWTIKMTLLGLIVVTLLSGLTGLLMIGGCSIVPLTPFLICSSVLTLGFCFILTLTYLAAYGVVWKGRRRVRLQEGSVSKGGVNKEPTTPPPPPPDKQER